jgi:hypothetical protein
MPLPKSPEPPMARRREARLASDRMQDNLRRDEGRRSTRGGEFRKPRHQFPYALVGGAAKPHTKRAVAVVVGALLARIVR